MEKQQKRSKRKIILHHAGEELRVETLDFIKFSVLFSDGREKTLVYDIDVSMEIKWNFANELSNELSSKIGSLVETECF